MRALALLSLVVLGCSTEPFSDPSADAGAADGDADRSVDGAVDAATDARVDAEVSPALCPVAMALLCDDWERTTIPGPWSDVETVGNGTLALVPGWSGTSLRAVADGVGSRAALAKTFASVASWTLRFDVDVTSAAPAFSTVAMVTTANETTAFEVDGASARIRSTALPQQTAPLGPFVGVRSVIVRRDAAKDELTVRIDGALVATLSLTVAGGASGAATLRVGVVEAGVSSLPAQVRVDRVAFTP